MHSLHVTTPCGQAVHFKGSAKPWRVFSCFGLREGRLVLRPANSHVSNSTLLPRVTLGPNDVLSWDSAQQACVSRTWGGSARGQAVTYAESALPLPKQCCRFTSLIKAEWWQHYRAGVRLPSLGSGDSWVRPGRWVRNKTAIDRQVASWWRLGMASAAGKTAPSLERKAKKGKMMKKAGAKMNKRGHDV